MIFDVSINVRNLLIVLATLSTELVHSNGSVDAAKCKPTNVRTVLFRKYDLDKACWALEDVGLLLNRYIMQALLPKVLPRNITVLLDYVIICLQTTDDLLSSEKSKMIIVEAIVDTFGGYLQSYGLPLTNQAFYEGNTDVQSAIKLHNLQEDFKKLLKTDGGGWAQPMVVRWNVCPIEPLSLRCQKDACRKIISNKSYLNIGKDKNDKKNGSAENVYITLPFFDDCKTPHALAVPLACRSLYSLTNRSSIGILVKYYEIGIACIKESCGENVAGPACRKRLIGFQKRFYNWLDKQVLPRLHDETWYPAFYRILPLAVTVERSIKEAGNFTDSDKRDLGCRRYTGGNILNKLKSFVMAHPFYTFWIFGLLLAFFILLWLCCFSKEIEVQENSECSCGCCKEEGGVSSSDKRSHSATTNDESRKSPDDKCPCCTCNTNAKAKFLAKFYCRGEQPKCCKTGSVKNEDLEAMQSRSD